MLFSDRLHPCCTAALKEIGVVTVLGRLAGWGRGLAWGVRKQVESKVRLKVELARLPGGLDGGGSKGGKGVDGDPRDGEDRGADGRGLPRPVGDILKCSHMTVMDTVDYYPGLRRKAVLTQAPAWMSPGDTVLNETHQSQRAKSCSRHSWEARSQIYRHRKGMVVLGLGEGRGSEGLMRTELQFGERRRFQRRMWGLHNNVSVLY